MRHWMRYTKQVSNKTAVCVGVWLSLARAPGLGPGSRRFESCHPDCHIVAANPRFSSKIKGLRLFSYFKVNLLFMWIKQNFINFLSRICPGLF